MEQTRDARRGTGRTTNNFSSIKRKIKQSEGKLNNGGVKTMARLGKASSRCYEDCEMTCLMSDVAPCNIKKIKLHKKMLKLDEQQFLGEATCALSEVQIIFAGANNKPQELDDIVLRRLGEKNICTLPDENVRRLLLKNTKKNTIDFNRFIFHMSTGGDLERLMKDTKGYSGNDLQALCDEGVMMPIRELGANILTVKANQVRDLKYGDFQKAVTVIRPSLQKSKWEELQQWNQEFDCTHCT